MPQISKDNRDQLQMLSITEHVSEDSLARVKENFQFDKTADTYTCSNGEILTKQARYKRKNKRGQISGEFDRYSIKYSICKNCQFLEQCVSKGNQKSHQGRYIDRYLTDEAVQNNKLNLKENKALYKRRQAIVEHPFGTIKRQWGFTHTLLKTIPKVQTEFSIIVLCYNLKRSISILGTNGLKQALKRADLSFLNTSMIITTLRTRIKQLLPLASPRVSLSCNL